MRGDGTQEPPLWHVWRAAVIAIAATAVVVAVALLAGPALLDRADRAFSDRPDCGEFAFSRTSWAPNAGAEGRVPSSRFGQGVGLAKCETLAGLAPSAVSELLGEPLDQRDGSWTYELGAPDGDTSWLEIAFDGGRVARAKVL
jgi:hypothetical protein